MAIRAGIIKFKRLHPSVAFAYYIGLLIFIFVVGHPLFLATTAMGLILLAIGVNGFRQSMKTFVFLLPVGLLIGLMNPLLVRRGATVLFYLWGNPVTLEAAAYGMYNFLLMLTLITLFLSFNRIIDQAAFLYLTSRWIPRTAFMANMALHAMSRFKTRAVTLVGVQQTKGFILSEGNLLTRFQKALRLLSAFTVRNLEEGMETAEVLKARDYTAARRTHYRSYRFAARDARILIFLLCLWAAVITGYGYGAARYVFYPRLQTLSLTPLDGILYGLSVIYVFFPLLYEIPNIFRRITDHAR